MAPSLATLKMLGAPVRRAAIQDKYESQMANETWTVVDRSAKGQVLTARWVLKSR